MRRLKLSLMGLVMTALAVNAQDKTAVKYANTITPEDMRAKLSILASDEFGGRETGTEGQKKASRFLEINPKQAISLKSFSICFLISS